MKINKSKKYCIFIDPLPSDVNHSPTKDIILSFNSYQCFIPLLFTERSEIESRIKKLENYEVQLRIVRNFGQAQKVREEINKESENIKKDERNMYLNGDYYITSERLPRMKASDLYQKLGAYLIAFKPTFENKVDQHIGLGKQILDFLGVDLGSNLANKDQKVIEEIKIVLNQFQDQIKKIQEYISDSPASFNIWYNLDYRMLDKDDPLNEMNQRLYSNTKIVVYKYISKEIAN